MESLYWADWTPASIANDYETKLRSGDYFLRRWPSVYPDSDVFVGDPGWLDANQGEVGDCYILAAMGTMAERPAMVEDAFITGEKNAAGIHGVRFYIRGKPWIIDIDD